MVADEATGKTVKDKVWAGGDIVTGAATVISAMGAGKRAAADIDKFLGGEGGFWGCQPVFLLTRGMHFGLLRKLRIS